MVGRSRTDDGAAKASGGATAAMMDNPSAGRVPTNVSVRQENEEAENPRSPIKTPDLGQSDRRSFEERLKEIDKEMGFLNENLGDLNVQEKNPCPSDTALKESENPGSIDISPRQGGRLPFKEVSNSPPINTLGKSTKIGAGSWKKKARAKNNGPKPIEVVLAEERTCDSMTIDLEVTGRPEKLLRTTPMEVESAAAGAQPRRDQ
ncbi:hypothetical protein FCV25MIE_02047 [Fagus crenata]